ncbi:hypothetical protein A0256_22630 [Mucilaginibacter sp. PAMC 26640]|nr:hypothetical protein A0256_22630 [Mucilaginibacter sp. PAMC 26640]
MDELKQIKPEWVPEAYREVKKATTIKIESVLPESAVLNPSHSFRKKTVRSLVAKRRRKG